MSNSTKNSIAQRFGPLLCGLMVGMTSGVFSYSPGDHWPSTNRFSEQESTFSTATAGEVGLPEGVHRQNFETSCMNCHSPLLVFNQPKLPKKKWGEIVHKMVSAYGAPIAKGDEPLLVDYLMAIQATR
jgi:hypothetical protein